MYCNSVRNVNYSLLTAPTASKPTPCIRVIAAILYKMYLTKDLRMRVRYLKGILAMETFSCKGSGTISV